MNFSTKGRKGKNSKTIRVETNDSANSKFNLKLTGEVKQFVTTIQPSPSSVPGPHMIVLRGTVGEKISEVFAVGSGSTEPLRILHADTLNQDNFRYSMTEIEIDGKPAYQFLVENAKTSAGNYQDKLFIFTDNAQFNPIAISVRGDIRPAETEKQKVATDPSAPEEAKTH